MNHIVRQWEKYLLFFIEDQEVEGLLGLGHSASP